jgi:hypothetical protein
MRQTAILQVFNFNYATVEIMQVSENKCKPKMCLVIGPKKLGRVTIIFLQMLISLGKVLADGFPVPQYCVGTF